MNRPVVCPHCRLYSSERPHMDPFAATPRLQIGQSVIALRNTYVCRTGEIGTVLEEHMVGDRPD